MENTNSFFFKKKKRKATHAASSVDTEGLCDKQDLKKNVSLCLSLRTNLERSYFSVLSTERHSKKSKYYASRN